MTTKQKQKVSLSSQRRVNPALNMAEALKDRLSFASECANFITSPIPSLQPWVSALLAHIVWLTMRVPACDWSNCWTLLCVSLPPSCQPFSLIRSVVLSGDPASLSHLRLWFDVGSSPCGSCVWDVMVDGSWVAIRGFARRKIRLVWRNGGYTLTLKLSLSAMGWWSVLIPVTCFSLA